MFDKFLAVGSGFDWITPLWAFVQDIRHGSSFQINIPTACGYSATQIENGLRQKGICVWGGMVVGQTITFSVRQTQAEYALYWLNRWGVPIEGHSELKESKSTRTQSVGEASVSPERGAVDTRGSLLDQVLDSVNGFADKLK